MGRRILDTRARLAFTRTSRFVAGQKHQARPFLTRVPRKAFNAGLPLVVPMKVKNIQMGTMTENHAVIIVLVRVKLAGNSTVSLAYKLCDSTASWKRKCLKL